MAALAAACKRDSADVLPSGAEGTAPAASAPLLKPSELSARLDEVRSGKLAVLHVGPQVLWEHGHVPGSRWVGEADTDDGLAAFEAAVRALPPEIEVVAYCGCCPTTHCPNIHPARRALASRAKASFLDLPTNFRTDWIQKGFPVEKA